MPRCFDRRHHSEATQLPQPHVCHAWLCTIQLLRRIHSTLSTLYVHRLSGGQAQQAATHSSWSAAMRLRCCRTSSEFFSSSSVSNSRPMRFCSASVAA